MKTVADVHGARERLEFEVDRFLRSRGWKSTSNNPAYIWLWEKKLDGKVYALSRNTALTFENLSTAEEEDHD